MTENDPRTIPALDEAHFGPAVPRIRRPVAVVLLAVVDALLVGTSLLLLWILLISGMSGGIGHPSPRDSSVGPFVLVALGGTLHLVFAIGGPRGWRRIWVIHLLVSLSILGLAVPSIEDEFGGAIVLVELVSLVLLSLPGTRRWARSNGGRASA